MVDLFFCLKRIYYSPEIEKKKTFGFSDKKEEL